MPLPLQTETRPPESAVAPPRRSGCLLVIVPDRLSALLRKGETVERYYNPGDFFEEVHLLVLADDSVERQALQPMVGSARLFLHRMPPPKGLSLMTAGYRPWLLRHWAKPAVALARRIQPRLIRCHGTGLQSYAAARIKEAMGIPYIVSLHGNPDVDGLRGRLGMTWKQRLAGHAMAAVEEQGLKQADFVIAVYEPIVPYLKRLGIRRHAVIYNAVSSQFQRKTDYALRGGRLRALCVGRQEPLQKDPSAIIEAVAALPQAELLLIGDGALHEKLAEAAAQTGGRIRLVRAMPNAQVLQAMAESDVFLYASVNYELSKTCIEAALTGLPIVMNDRNGAPASELQGGHFLLVDGSASSYRSAIERLAADEPLRVQLGAAAAAHADSHWAPQVMEARVADLYYSLMAARGD